MAGSGSRSAVVAAAILGSRLMGLARERALAYFLGTSPQADVFRVALRGPNLLQNLLGEGTLSASFIPIYSRMLEEGREEEAGRFAGAVFGLLLAVAAVVAAAGVALAEPIVAVIATGFLDDPEGASDRYPLAVTAVRITFPMTAVLVLHAWALGVLNSHRRFFLPYFAPVLWNAAIIAGLVGVGELLVAGDLDGSGPIAAVTRNRLLFAACVGALVGGLLQFLVQVPLVWRVLRGFRPSFSTRVGGVREALGAFGPIVAGRGAAQLGGYLDVWLASLLAAGAVAAMGYAQTLYLLPISLFAMSVAAAELPELSRAGKGSAGTAHLERVDRALGQIAFLTLPTVVGYLAFGLLVAGALFRTGSFDADSQWLVYLLLAAYTVGLPATNTSRLLQNVFYALGETKPPARVVVERIVLSAAVAAPLMWGLDRVPLAAVAPVGADPETGRMLRLGAVGLGIGSAVGAWYELARLRRLLGARIEGFRLPLRRYLRAAGLAVAAAVPAAVAWRLLPELHVIVEALVVVGLFGGLYLAGALVLGFPELEAWTGRLVARLRRGRRSDGGGE